MSLKNKKIEKVSKKTRAFVKKGNQRQLNQVRLLAVPKCQAKGKKVENLKSRLKKSKEEEQRSSGSQKIVVDLNLGQFGFDSVQPKNPGAVAEIEEILRACEEFSLNPNLEKMEWKQMCSELISRLQNENYLIRHRHNHLFYSVQQKMLIEISHEEYALWQCAHTLFTRIKSGATSPGLAGVIASETLHTRQLLAQSKQSLLKFREIERRKQIHPLTDQLELHVVFKTFCQGLKVPSINLLNYFLIKEFEENSRLGRREAEINNWQQWAQFIQKKRVRLRKANKYLLHTACQLCLSSYSQQGNQMMNCPQCHIRGHRLCLGGQKNVRCGRCTYLRLSSEMKQKIPECFICNMTNLVPTKISSSKFAHIFCLIASQMWHMEDSSIRFRRGSDATGAKLDVCQFCKKETAYSGKCRLCTRSSHFICAYMNGACFQVEAGFSVSLSCCQMTAGERERIGEERKFILNYNNVVFRKLGVIQRSSKKKRRRNERGAEDRQSSDPSEQQEPGNCQMLLELGTGK